MIGKLRLKFIVLSMTSLFALLMVIIVGMNLLNYNTVISDADEVLSLLSQNKGAFPDFEDNPRERLPRDMSPEIPYESRFFSVLLNEDGSVVQLETSRIAAIDAEMAIEYGQSVLASGAQHGFLEDFRYVVSYEEENVRITFLDCGRKLNSFWRFLLISVGMALTGFVVVFFVIFFFAGRIIRPIAESYEKQKRFITDAGHEIKTPLTIINANVDVLEMDLGENECLADIQQQTKRLTKLTNELVMLARMEEAGDTMPKIDFPVSEVVADAALPFRTLAMQQDKEFTCNIQPMLSMNGNGKAVEQLVTLLMDNALKYSPAGGKVALDFVKQSKSLHLTVFNTTATEVSCENLNHVFERFYRTDLSRNSQTGGHGIGLSVAKAIVTAHGGKIQATTKDGHSFQILVVLPL
ncbi:MAG: HAMP domain-containing histidine kinase [Clostridiales bacterium]|nr:HAMP domain-containing histidine kinase [Clostridiales bacterium]